MNGFTFDYLKKYEAPNIILALQNKKTIGIFPSDMYKNLNLNLRFNAFSEISFIVKSHYKDTTTNKLVDNPYYKSLTKNKLIFLPDIGWFVINSVSEDIENKVYEKTINCYSYEKTLEQKNINLLDGTYKFYNALNPSDTSTLVGKIMSMLPSWKIGYVDEQLWNKYRTFEIPDSNVYNFLMNDVEKAYECIFDFDILNQVINIYTVKSMVKKTDIVLTFDNLIKKIDITETDNPIITALGVFGNGDLDIRNVNPTGSVVIYNFEHYYDCMSDSLVTAIKNWNTKIESNRKVYSDNLSLLKQKNAELLKLNTKLTDLNSEKKAIEQIRTVQMPNVETSIMKQLRAKEDEITQQEQLIVTKENEITVVKNTLTNINKSLSFDNNFTQAQRIELDPYIYESSYRNENYIKTKIMTPVDVQDMSMQLLEQGQEQLKILSQPSYTFTMDTANFMFLKEYEVFIQALSLGCLINVESKPNEWLQPILLEMNIDYDNPDSFSLVFGNRFKLQTSEWTFGELFKENNRTSANVNINSNLWGEPVKSGLVNEVNNYMTTALDLSKQDIINNKNSEVTFGEFGLRLKRKLVQGDVGYIKDKITYDPIQVWLYNKGMGFTTDNWETCKAFFGTITMPDGSNHTGLIAPTIVGNLIAGQQMRITNENNSFTLDGNGATLVNANFTLTSSNNKAKITLSPQDGIKIQTNNNGWKDSFYVDTQGDLTISSKITAVSGNIGGWRISKDGLYNDNNGDYLGTNGYGKLSLLSWTPYSADFDGNIYARNLGDKIQTDNVEDGSITSIKLAEVYAKRGEFQTLKSHVATIDELVADKASISQLNVLSARIDNLSANKADISQLNVLNAKIDNLNVVGKITAGSLDVSKINFDGSAAKISRVSRIVTDIDLQSLTVCTGVSVTGRNKDGAITSIKNNPITVTRVNGYRMVEMDYIGVNKKR